MLSFAPGFSQQHADDFNGLYLQATMLSHFSAKIMLLMKKEHLIASFIIKCIVAELELQFCSYSNYMKGYANRIKTDTLLSNCLLNNLRFLQETKSVA